MAWGQNAIRVVDVSQVVEPKSRVMNAPASVLNLCELCASEAASGAGRRHSCPYCPGMQRTQEPQCKEDRGPCLDLHLA